MKKSSSNFNKLFATTAIATVAIVVPTAVAGAEEVEEITPAPTPDPTPEAPAPKEISGLIKVQDNPPIINYTIEADIELITGNYIIEKYEWYYVETVRGEATEFIIPGATSKTLKVPLEAFGKSIQVKVTAQEVDSNNIPVKKDGKDVQEVFTDTQPHDVKDIDILIDSIPLVGVPEAFVGDIITIGEIKLKDKDTQEELLFENNQIKYSFQWYVKEGTKYSIIPGETNRSLTVTSSMKDKEISAQVSFELNGKEYSKFAASDKLGDVLNKVNELKEDIGKLLALSNPGNQDVYDFGFINSKYDSLTDATNDLLSRYNALGEDIKKQITNIDIVLDAEKNIIVVNEFIKALKEATVKIPSKDPNQSNQLTEGQIKNLEQIQLSLESQYDALDSLQRSLFETNQEVNYDDGSEGIKALLAEILENKQYDKAFEKVDAINTNLNDLFLPGHLLSSYNETYKEVSNTLASIKEEIAKLDKQYLPFINNTLVKQVEADLKKAEAAIKKINKISEVGLDKKKATANTAYKAYLALTPLQKSLISEEQNDLMESGRNIENELDDKLINLNEDIVANLFDGPNDSNSYNAYSVDLLKAQEETAALLATYKMLTSAEKKFITNYRFLTAAQNDIKAALKVNKLFEEAEELENNINGETDKEELSATKKAISKYKSAISSHSKLTQMQQTLISDIQLNGLLATYGGLVTKARELEQAIKLDKNPDADVEELPNLALNDSIAGLILSDNKYNGQIPNFQESVNELMEQYNALSSKEKKGIYNYPTLAKANSDIKKAIGVYSKLQAAASANDQKKYNSALASYNKLTALQQSLIDLSKIDTDGMEELKEPVLEVEEDIRDLIGNYDIKNIEEAKKLYDALTSSQKKLVSNYNVLKDLLKDVAAVKNFISKMDKLGYNPTLAQKESILKSYYKLSETQAKLFQENYNVGGEYQSPVDRLIAYENDVFNKTAVAKGLNDKIKTIIEDTSSSLANLSNEIDVIEAEYLAIPSADQKLVTNYSKLNRVKKDIEAVKKAIELEGLKETETDPDSEAYKKAEKEWKNAYNRLTQRQLYLYDNR